MRIQQCICVFLWLAMHDRNANRAKHALTNTPRCGLCEDEDETTLHVLCDCKVAREVWRQVGGPQARPPPDQVTYNN